MVDDELFCKIIRRIEAVTGVKALPVLVVAALHLTVMSQ